MGVWCAALRSIRDDVEKEHAFLGLMAMLRLNPQVPPSTRLSSSSALLHKWVVCRACVGLKPRQGQA